MLFNSLQYILFVIVVVSGFWLVARHGGIRILLLLVASWIFYMTWNPIFIGLIIGSTVWDFLLGQAIHDAEDPRRKKLFVSLSVIGNLGLLGLFRIFFRVPFFGRIGPKARFLGLLGLFRTFFGLFQAFLGPF